MTPLLVALVVSAVAVSVTALVLSIGTAARVSRLEARATIAMATRVGSSISPEVQALAEVDWSHGRIALVFASSGCAPCGSLLTELEAMALDGTLLIAARSASEISSLKGRVRNLTAQWVADTSGILFTALGVVATPHAFVIDRGTVMSERLGPTASWLRDALTARTKPRPDAR